MENKLISVIMSVYNTEKYLAEAIESILNQSYKHFEFIIINDGSSDNSLEIIQRYDLLDNRIILINQKNKGLTKSLNIAIKRASGYYIARQDADDISLPNRFLNFMTFIKDNGHIDMYSTPAYIINETSEVEKTIPNYFRRNGFNKRLLDYYNSMIHGTLIIRSKIIKDYLYNEDFRFSQDFELYHRLMSFGYIISYDKNNITYKLRIHGDSISRKNSNKQNKFNELVFVLNNKKLYELSFFNRLYFKVIDVLSFIKEKVNCKTKMI